MPDEPCESYHISHPTPCLDCKRKDERFHQLEARVKELEAEIAECVASAIELDIFTVHDVKAWGKSTRGRVSSA